MNHRTAQQLDAQIPAWLQITKVSDAYYRVVDTSVDAIGFHLGSFSTRQAAQHFAIKVSEVRAEVRNRNRYKLQRIGHGEAEPTAHT